MKSTRHRRAGNAALQIGELLVLFLSIGNVAASSDFAYERNGVRLVGGDVTKGRLELRPRSWFTTNWTPVCDEDVSDELAATMCKMLGYSYGRRYYNERLLTGNITYSTKAGDVYCTVKSGGNGRRQLRETGAAASQRGRSLLAPQWGQIDGSDTAPYTCMFREGTCNPALPVAGVECSNRVMPPAPPPATAPVSAPPPAPPAPRLIRIRLKRGFDPEDVLEPNLCSSTTAARLCLMFGRVEIEINSTSRSSPGTIWAPVCHINDAGWAGAVAEVACEQRYQVRRAPWLPNMYIIDAEVSPIAFRIPKDEVTGEGDFNPADVKGWVTFPETGNGTAGAAKLQDLKYKVTTSPCAGRRMMAIACRLIPNHNGLP